MYKNAAPRTRDGGGGMRWPAPSTLNAGVWKYFGFSEAEGKKDPDKSRIIRKLCGKKHLIQNIFSFQEKDCQQMIVWYRKQEYLSTDRGDIRSNALFFLSAPEATEKKFRRLV